MFTQRDKKVFTRLTWTEVNCSKNYHKSVFYLKQQLF